MYTQSLTGTIRNTAGKQAVQIIACNGNQNQFTVSTGSGYNVQQNHSALFNMNPNTTTTGSALLGSIVSPVNDRIYVRNYMWNCIFTNFTSAATILDLYVIVPKRDCAMAPDAAWANGYTDDALNLPASAPPAAGNPPGFSNLGYPLITQPTNKPWESHNFNDNYRIKKLKHQMLATSATMQMNVNVEVNYLAHRDKINRQNGLYIANTTCFLMAVAYGQVVEDITVGVAHVISTALVSVGYVIQSRTGLSCVADPAGRIGVMAQTQQFAAGAGAAAVQMVDVNDVVAVEDENN